MIRVLLAIVFLSLVAGCNQNEGETPPSNIIDQPNFAREKFETELVGDAEVNTNLIHRNNGYFPGEGSLPREPFLVDLSIVGNVPDWLIGINNSVVGIVWGTLTEGGVWSSTYVRNEANSQVLIAEAMEEDSAQPPIVRIDDPSGSGTALFANSRRNDPVLLRLLAKFENTPDGMSVFGDQARLFSHAAPTDTYSHGALGDRLEWTQLVASTISTDIDVDRYVLPGDEVFESLYPLVADFDSDGVEEVVTTVSNSVDGARLVVFDYDGTTLSVIAESDPVGTGFRWLHQIAVAPFGPNGEIEIAVVETPHVGGIAKFYRLDGDRLELVASKAGGYMSHVNGTRNLDQAVAGDFDGDGAVELIVPSRDQKSLIALRRAGDSVEEVWELKLDSRLTTNLAVVETIDGGLALGAGTEDGILHIWQ